MSEETVESPVENPVDFSLIAIALVSRTIDTTKYAEGSYTRFLTEYEVGDLVVNISDVFADEDCLDRVGTVLEIRDQEVEIRRLDGLTHCTIGRMGTYLAAKGVNNVST